MSSNVVRLMHARGMGSYQPPQGLGGWYDGYQSPQGLGAWYDEWGKDIIGQGFDFGKAFIGAKYAKDAAKFQVPGAGTGANYYTGQQGATPPTSNDEYGSGGISSAGIRIGGTLVTWPVIGLGVGVLVLLQSKGFTRKG